MLKKSILGQMLAFCMLISFSMCGKKDEDTPPPPAPEKPKPIKLELMDHTNGETPFNDSIYLTFSKKIKVNYIKSTYEYCITDDMGITYADDKHGFKFKYGCAELGRSYPFEYSVTDEEGNTLTNKITIDFFTKRINFEGYSVQNAILSSDNNHFWITITNDEGTLSRILSLSTDSLKTEFDISIPKDSRAISYNPYNGFLYISSFYDPRIFVVDPIREKLVKTINLQVLPQDEEIYPAIFPGNICFTKNGLGLLNVHNDISGGSIWKTIDSTLGDSIYYDAKRGIYNNIIDFTLLSDSTQIIGYNDESNKFVIIDQIQKNVVKTFDSPISPGAVTPAIKASKKDNMVMFYGLGNAFMDTKTNDLYYYDNGLFPWDFSYRSNENGYAFCLRNSKIVLFDYMKGKEIFSYPVGIGLTYTEITSDGKYLFCAGTNGIYMFSEKMFAYKNKG